MRRSGYSTQGGIAGDADNGVNTGAVDDVSALGEMYIVTPMVIPTRGHLDSVKKFMRGDLYIGRGSRQRNLGRCRYCNNFKVDEVGRDRAIQEFRTYLLGDKKLHGSLWTLSGRRLVCHCQLTQRCHGDALVEEFKNSYPDAYDRNKLDGEPPSAAVLNFMARLREEPEEDSDSTADEGVPVNDQGIAASANPWRWASDAHRGNTATANPWHRREDGPPGSRNYPSSPDWVSVASQYQKFTECYGTEQLLVSLALGKIKESPFEKKEIEELKGAVISELEGRGYTLGRCEGDREDVPIDYRYLGLLLRVADDPEVGIAEYAQGVRVGPGVRMPRLPALYRQKRRWRLPEQTDPLDYLERTPDEGMTWRRNYASLEQWKEQVLEVMQIRRRGDRYWYCQRRRRVGGILTSSLRRWELIGRINPTARSRREYFSTERMVYL